MTKFFNNFILNLNNFIINTTTLLLDNSSLCYGANVPR